MEAAKESAVGASAEDLQAIEALRAGDEAVFSGLVDRYGGALLRLAQSYVRDRPTAEEVVQEAWIGLLQGIHRFEGRSSLKTWLFRILVNCARARARKDSRSVPFSSLFDEASEPGEPAVDPERFLEAGHRQAGHWSTPPAKWHEDPELAALSAETLAFVKAAIDDLPGAQRQVIALRDVQGFTSAEVCNMLGISDTNQRVLLHRARSKVRRALEQQLDRG